MYVQRATHTFASANRNLLLWAGRSSVALGRHGHNGQTHETVKWHVPMFLKMPVKSEVGHIV